MIEKRYFCLKCNYFHYRGKIYDKHLKYALIPTNNRIFKLFFKRNFKRYSIENHKKTRGSRKQ